MAKLYSLQQIGPSCRANFFDRHELNQLLTLYSIRVARGEWRDYAIDHSRGSAVFSVFRHTHDAPVFRIVKRPKGAGHAGEYVVSSGAQTLKEATTMTEALKVFDGCLRVVL